MYFVENDLWNPSDAGAGSPDHAWNDWPGSVDGTFGRLFPRDRGRGDHANRRYNAFIPEPDHGVCSGSPVGNQRAECNPGQCVY